MIYGRSRQTSHTSGDNFDVEGMLPPNKNYQVSSPFRDPGLGHSLDYPNHVYPTEPSNFDEWVIVNMKNEMCKEVEISKVREVKCALAQPK